MNSHIIGFKRGLPGDAVIRGLCISAFFLLAACTSTAQRPGPRTPEIAPEPVAGEQAELVRIEPVRPAVELSEEILYKILVAEFAGQRGMLDVSLQNYLDLARTTRDPAIVERATRIAVYARDAEAAIEAAQLWVELDPQNPDPHQVLAVMAIREGDLEEALDHLQQILDYSHGKMEQKLWMIANLLSREKDREAVLTLMQDLLTARNDAPEALFAFAQVAARLGELDQALELLEKLLAVQPRNDNAALSYISILQRQKRVNDAIAWLESVLQTRDDGDFNLRLAYARLLTDAKRFDDARRQFEILVVQAPNKPDILYALGLLYLQANRLPDAEVYFQRLTERSLRADDAKYYLGRIAEERKDLGKAGVWYQGVQGGDNYFDSQVRLALIIAKQGRLQDAREHLNSIRTKGEQEATILIQAEAELLIEEKRYEEAMQVYDRALDGNYNSDLLYARAMLAEKLDLLDVLEADLKRILEREPEHAQALNALGYTLADRTQRLQEAHVLIERALALNPSDFYILDSMGWVLYRLGRLEEASEYLRKAMSMRQDPEIAAHLGEVLWVMGDKAGAKQVWENALQVTPDDQRLLEVIERFEP